MPAKVEDGVLAARVAPLFGAKRPPSRPESVRFLVACARAAEALVLETGETGEPIGDLSAVGGNAVYTPAAGQLSERELVWCAIDLGLLSVEPGQVTDETIAKFLDDATGPLFFGAADLMRALGDMLPEGTW